MFPYIQPPRQPDIRPYPYLWLRITDNTKNLNFALFGAIIDSGADHTCIPQTIVARTPGWDYDEEQGGDFAGNLVTVKRVRIRMATVELLDTHGNVLMQNGFQNLKLPIVGVDGLLGRDILNDTICMLDGPRQMCSIT